MDRKKIEKYIYDFHDIIPQTTTKKPNDSDEVICKRCKKLAISSGSTIHECIYCGDLLENVVDNSPEWRYYGSEGNSKVDPTRCGTAINYLLPKSSMSTIMLSTGNSNYSMRKTKKMHTWGSLSYKERCLNKVFQDISLRSLNGCILNSIIKLSHEYYKKVSELHVSRGEIRKGLIAASLYMSCKKIGVPRTTTEIADIFQVTERCVTRGNKKFSELWQLSGEKPIIYIDDCQSSDYLVRFCCKLAQGDALLLSLATKMTNLIKDNCYLEQNTPVSVSAAAIYFVCLFLNNGITRLDISKITNTSEVTIAKCHKELSQYSDMLYYNLELKS
jgi:transcription initiation factor TFIIB